MWSETISLKGVPPVSAEPHGWGISVSRSGDFHMSAINSASLEAVVVDEGCSSPTEFGGTTGTAANLGDLHSAKGSPWHI